MERIEDAGDAGTLGTRIKNALSPLAILSRGYAACFDAAGRLLRSAQQIKAGGKIEVRLGKGRLGATVNEIGA